MHHKDGASMNTKYHQTEGFKFPAAGLIGLDAGTKASVSKFLRQRERDLNTFETAVITCEGGPFNGQSLELECSPGATYSSAEFCIGAWRGHYLGSKWVSTLAADAPAPEAMAAPLPRPKINCDLPAKGFDQLRDLLGEMSINPLEQETTIKTRYKTAWFQYGKTDDFGNEIVEFSPVGAYACELVQFVTPARGKKTKPAIVYKIKRSNAQHGAMAMDDFGDLFITQPRANEREEMTEKRQFTTYKIGRTSYTIPATVEAVERLAAKILKVKKFCSDKLLSLGGTACPAVKTQPNRHIEPAATMPAAEPQPVAIVIDAPPSPALKIEQPAKPLEPVSFLTPKQIAWMDQVKVLHNRVMAEQSRIKNERIAQFMRDAEPPPSATTCNPEAARLRAKATICRHANRPAWAKILEDKADALERIEQPEPPEPPPGNKPKTDNPPSLAPMRQRPHKTACRRIVKTHHHIRHTARHLGSKFLSQKYGHPVRQKLMHRRAERPVSNIHEPPAIKTVTPSGNFYKPNQDQPHATPTI